MKVLFTIIIVFSTFFLLFSKNDNIKLRDCYLCDSCLKEGYSKYKKKKSIYKIIHKKNSLILFTLDNLPYGKDMHLIKFRCRKNILERLEIPELLLGEFRALDKKTPNIELENKLIEIYKNEGYWYKLDPIAIKNLCPKASSCK